MELKDVKGLGQARIKSLSDAGIVTVLDLLNHFPKKYYDFNNCQKFNGDGLYKLLFVEILTKPKVIKLRGGVNFVSASCVDLNSNTKLTLTWFGQTYVASTISISDKLYVYGKNSPTKKANFIVSMHKKEDENLNKTKGLFPVYKTFSGVGQTILKNSVTEVLNNYDINGLLNENVEQKHNLIPIKTAYSMVHCPKTLNDIYMAKERLMLENSIVFAHINSQRKIYSKQKRTNKFKNIKEILEEYKKLIPYKLTNSQQKAIFEINNDLTSEYTCNRLIQGDTGSGKTLVAMWSMFLCAKNKFQSILMAPTEILAEQHYNFAKKIFNGYDFKISLLTANMSKSEKNEIIRGIMCGDISIIIGTQALLSEKIDYPNLQLIISDEQHRFGVLQRAQLSAKGSGLDMISMSATPIPRSINLVLFGGLDITRMEERPFAQNIQTNLVNGNKENDMWQFIKNQIENNRTCYVVCSKIDDDEDKDQIISTSSMYKKLTSIFGDEIVCELTGKMKDDKKNSVLKRFKNGEIKILVATTVVEVGVDSLNAGVIVIANPERFGLATLHQLRGRVGRDGTKSYCFCLINNLISEQSAKRLVFFKNNNDGFKIADYDLKIRGAGDMYGTKQHGLVTSNEDINLTIYNKAQKIYDEIKEDKTMFEKIDFVSHEKYDKLIKNIVLN